jgi:hypothetical protein
VRGDMSLRGLLFQWTSTIKIQLRVMVWYKADLIIISLKINLFSPLYRWTIAELVINNNHSLNCYNVQVEWEQTVVSMIQCKTKDIIWSTFCSVHKNASINIYFSGRRGSFIYNYLCSQCLSPLMRDRGEVYNIMW